MTLTNATLRNLLPVSLGGRAGDPNAGDLNFRRGWFASGKTVPHDVGDNWDRFRIGSWHFNVHPALSVSYATQGEFSVTVLGDAIDLENALDSSAAVAMGLVRTLGHSESEAIKTIAYLAGRFTIVLETPTRSVIMTDCAGTMPTFWHHSAGNTILSSHVHLVGELTGAPLDKVGIGYVPMARKMETKGTLYTPGIRTPFVGVRPILPNHLLSLADSVDHVRYYPFTDTDLDRDPDSTFERFQHLFTTHTEILAKRGKIGLSVTGGLDSRAAMAAALPFLDSDTSAWTYIFPHDPPSGMVLDAINGSALAFAAGIRHRLLPAQESQNQEFAAAYKRSFAYTRQMPRLPHTYFDHVPRDTLQLQCMVAEVGTGFYKNRKGSPSIERLSYLYCPFPFGQTQEVREAWEMHAEYAPLPEEGPVDFHDLFYWETRIGRWGALRIQEIDMAHQIISPFNARGIIEALQGPDLSQRRNKQALRRFITLKAPHLDTVPITS